jgi:hypothetical protein
VLAGLSLLLVPVLSRAAHTAAPEELVTTGEAA